MSTKTSPQDIQRKGNRRKNYHSRLRGRRNQEEITFGRGWDNASTTKAQPGNFFLSDRRQPAILLVCAGLGHVFLFGAVLCDDNSNIVGSLTLGTQNG